MPRWFDERRGATMVSMRLAGEVTQVSFAIEVAEILLGDHRERCFYQGTEWQQDALALTPVGRWLVTEIREAGLTISIVIKDSMIQIELVEPRVPCPKLQKPTGSIDPKIKARLNGRGRDVVGLISAVLEEAFTAA